MWLKSVNIQNVPYILHIFCFSYQNELKKYKEKDSHKNTIFNMVVSICKQTAIGETHFHAHHMIVFQ